MSGHISSYLVWCAALAWQQFFVLVLLLGMLTFLWIDLVPHWVTAVIAPAPLGGIYPDQMVSL